MKKCLVCKIVALIAGVSALNWGLYAFLQVDLVGMVLGNMTPAAKAAYGIAGVSGLLVLISLVLPCPCCK